MISLEDAKNNIGRAVIYTPFKNCEDSIKERGYITSVNNMFIFVRYSYSNNGIATYPGDLEFEIEPTKEINNNGCIGYKPISKVNDICINNINPNNVLCKNNCKLGLI
jgi:hypothetical protein